MLYAAIYASFTVIYWACGGTDPYGASYIYPQTDYSGSSVSSAVTQAGMFFIGLPVCQSLIFCIYYLRVWIKGKMQSSSGHPNFTFNICDICLITASKDDSQMLLKYGH